MRRILAVVVAGIVLSSCGESTLVREAHEAVRDKLVDPASAVFDDEERFFVFTDKGLVCGKVNAKNRMGGYSGEQRYAYARGTGAELSEGDYRAFSSIHDRCMAASDARTKRMELEAWKRERDKG